MRRETHARARDRYIQAATEALLALEAEQCEAEAADTPGIDYAAGLTAVQRGVLDVLNEPLAMLWGRRTGKTHVLPRLLLRGADEPGTWSVYLTKTRKNAKLLLWRWLKQAARQLQIPHRTNETDLVMEVDGGGSILLGGADDLAAIERWRQFGWKRAVLDEMGVYPDDLLTVLIDDVIQPATADHGGQIVYSGTPGYLLGGRWYELSGPDAPIRVSRADARSNTAVPGIWDRILEIKRERGWADDHPTWVREYLGQWVQDAGSLVYPYSPKLNGCAGLPTHTITGVRLPPGGWRYALGVDVGFVDATAFVLLAAHELDPRDFVVQSEEYTGMLPEEVAEHIRHEYMARYPKLQIAMDTGGMGKIHEATTRRRYALPVHAAEKREKPDAIRDFRGRIQSGRIQVLDGAQNDAIRACWAKLGWDKKREHHHPDQEDHSADAALYADRLLHNYRSDAPELPRPLTSEEEAARLREAFRRRHMPKQSKWSSGWR